MRVRATTSTLLIAALLCLCASIPASAQQKKEWTWKDRDGKIRTRNDLAGMLFHGRKDFRYVDLSGADLAQGWDLRGASRTAPTRQRDRHRHSDTGAPHRSSIVTRSVLALGSERTCPLWGWDTFSGSLRTQP
jgi:hypothetical protein